MELDKIYNEPCLETMARLPDNSVNCIITSPPYYQLREYDIEFDAIWDEDKDCTHDFNLHMVRKKTVGDRPSEKSVIAKNRRDNENRPTITNNVCVKCGAWKGQLGLEPTFELYLQHLWQIMDELYRILKPDGTCWFNIADTYNTISGNMKQKSYSATKNSSMDNSVINKENYTKSKTVKKKSLLLIPSRFAIGCIDRGWILRNAIIWASKNKMPESVTDRFSKKYEFMFFFVKSQKYYFDLDAIREKHLYSNDSNDRQSRWSENYVGKNQGKRKTRGTQGYSAASGMQQDVNGGVGFAEKGKNCGDVSDFWDIPTKPNTNEHYASYNDSLLKKPILAGCPVGGLVYDPFMGTGSTAEVAIRAGRNYIGSELSKKYYDDAEKRLLPFKEQLKIF